MKYDKLIIGLGTLVVIGGSVMKIMHLPYASTTLLFGLIGMSVFQTWHVAQLKKRIQELEKGER